jgi:hypothetical protein
MFKLTLADAPALREGDYLTDQQHLFRVLQIVPVRVREWAAVLEDCRTLDAAVVPSDELVRMKLRLVRVTDSCSAQ